MTSMLQFQPMLLVSMHARCTLMNEVHPYCLHTCALLGEYVNGASLCHDLLCSEPDLAKVASCMLIMHCMLSPLDSTIKSIYSLPLAGDPAQFFPPPPPPGPLGSPAGVIRHGVGSAYSGQGCIWLNSCPMVYSASLLDFSHTEQRCWLAQESFGYGVC